MPATKIRTTAERKPINNVRNFSRPSRVQVCSVRHPLHRSTSLPIRPTSIIAHIFQSAMNDQSGYLKLAGLFFSMKKWPTQAKP